MLVSISRASELYECSDSNFSAMYHYNKKEGVDTPWMKIVNGHFFVDTVEYERQSSITQRCWDFNTTYLYWLMMELFKTEAKIAEYLAEKSKEYKSVQSWVGFIRVTMFQSAGAMRAKLQLTQQAEFTRIASRAIYVAIKDGVELGKDFYD